MELVSLLGNALVAVGWALLFAALVWLLKVRRHQEADARPLFRGTFEGGLKLFIIYFVVMPLLLEAPASPELTSFFRTLMSSLVLILGVELFAYIFTHFAKYEKEILTLGILGGITRSEAVFGEFIDLLRHDKKFIGEAVEVILIASTVMLLRNLVIVAAVSLDILSRILVPMLVMAVLSSIIIYYSFTKTKVEDIVLKSVSLKAAVQIVFYFAVVTAAIQYLSPYGNIGLYAVSTIGAFGGALPILFSTLVMYNYNTINAVTAGNMIFLASLVAFSNDSLTAFIFHQPELAKKLLIRSASVGIVGFVVFLFTSGILAGYSL